MSADSEKNGLDVDSAVTPTAPLYRQLLQAYAEESAVEDAIYYLGEGLRKGVIDLDTFLKVAPSSSYQLFFVIYSIHSSLPIRINQFTLYSFSACTRTIAKAVHVASSHAEMSTEGRFTSCLKIFAGFSILRLFSLKWTIIMHKRVLR